MKVTVSLPNAYTVKSLINAHALINAHWKIMGQNNLTFWSMFANSLFNRQKNMFVFIFISQIHVSYKQMEFTVLNREQKFIQ